MINESLGWVVERVRKGVEFEVEGAMVKGAAETIPHCCVVALGVSLTQAQIGLGATVIVAGGVWYVVHRRRARRAATEALRQVTLPPAHPEYSDCN